MKSLFSRFSDTQAGSSKPTKESSYKFWIPSNTNAERSPPKSIPVHPDVAASHGEKRYRALNSAHALKVPLLDISTAPLETQAIRTNDMARHTTRQNIGSSSMPYSQNYPPISSRTPRPHEHGDTKYQVYSREAQGPAYPSGTHSRETSGKSHRGGRRESWLPSTTPAVSKQVEDEAKLHVQGRSEKIERYRESGDERDRGKELERREKDRDRDRKEKEREWEKGRIREREREERDRERSRAKERERILEKEREIARAKREQDRNLEIGRERDRDKYTERDHRERERDSDREGEKGKNRTKDKGSRKESSNLTRGTERALNSDVPYDGERTKQEERNKVHHRGRATGGGRKDDSYESQKERDRWLEKEPERARERLGGQIKHRAEATDGEQDAGRVRTPAPDRERRRDPGIGWASDTHTGHSRKLLRKTSNTLINPSPGVEDGESSDSSTRPKYMHQLLTKRHRAEEGGGSSSKIIHRQGMSAEPFGSTKPSAVKATIVSFSEDVQLPVPPTPQHMPIYLPPKESYIIDAGLPPTIVPLNVVSAREAEALSRREILNRLKSSRPDEPPPHAGDVSRPREIDTPIVRRPPSRGPAQPQNLFPSHATIAHSSKGTRESGYIHRVSFYFAL
ncbi:hypothetical protein BYT27DRAFT_6911414 [Phlegmacium glaucopus]|nr:hypothetical protein BYT27DRAFT_6911414 [Phlegmacium glaucopus]